MTRLVSNSYYYSGEGRGYQLVAQPTLNSFTKSFFIIHYSDVRDASLVLLISYYVYHRYGTLLLLGETKFSISSNRLRTTAKQQKEQKFL